MNEFFSVGGCPTDKQMFTGSGNCDVKKGYIKHLLITKMNAKYEVPADGNMDAIIAEALALPYTDPNKMWIVNDIVTNGAPEGGDNISSTAGERGGSRIVGQNPMSVTYSVVESLCRKAYLLKFKGLNMRVFEVDENNKVFGVAHQIGDMTYFVGVKNHLWVTSTPATAGADALLNINLAHDINYFTKEEPYQSNLEITEVPSALLPVTLKKSGLGKAKLIVPCSGEDVGERIGALLDKTGFVAQSGADFNVAYDAATSEYVFTTVFDTPIPNIDSFKLAPVAALNNLNIFDIEGIEEFVALDSVPTAEATVQLVKQGKGTAKIMSVASPAVDYGSKIGSLLTAAAFVEQSGAGFTVTFDEATGVFTFMTTDEVPVLSTGKFKLVAKSALIALDIIGVVGNDTFVELNAGA